MADQIFPIIGIPGLIDGWAGTDFLVKPSGSAGNLTTLFVSVVDAPSGGSVVLSLRNATGGGGDGIDATIADAETTVEAAGSVALTGIEDTYLRVVSASGGAMSLSGYFLFDGTVPGIAALTTLARFKGFLGITVSTDDALINQVIAGVSTRMQGHMHRSIIQQAISSEKLDGNGRTRMTLAEFPVITPPAVAVSLNGDTVATTEYEVDEPAGQLVKVVNGAGGRWTRGVRNYDAVYTAGYASVPEDLAFWATVQAAQTWLLTAPGGKRIGDRGSILDAGGSAQYLTGPWAPGVLDSMAPYINRRAA